MKIKLLFISMCLCFLAQSQPSLKRMLLSGEKVDLLQDLLFLYELDDLTIGTGNVNDSHTGNYDGSSENSSGFLSVNNTGILNKAYRRTGQDDGWSSHSFTTTVVSSYTVSLWVKGESTIAPSDEWFLYNFSNNAEGIRVVKDIDIGYLFLDVYVWTGSTYTFVTIPNGRITDNAWHHIVLSRSLTGFKLYIDGSLAHTYSGALGSFTLFQFRGGGSPYHDDFEGYYDQQGFWVRQLNGSEVIYLNNNGSGRTYLNF